MNLGHELAWLAEQGVIEDDDFWGDTRSLFHGSVGEIKKGLDQLGRQVGTEQLRDLRKFFELEKKEVFELFRLTGIGSREKAAEKYDLASAYLDGALFSLPVARSSARRARIEEHIRLRKEYMLRKTSAMLRVLDKATACPVLSSDLSLDKPITNKSDM